MYYDELIIRCGRFLHKNWLINLAVACGPITIFIVFTWATTRLLNFESSGLTHLIFIIGYLAITALMFYAHWAAVSFFYHSEFERKNMSLKAVLINALRPFYLFVIILTLGLAGEAVSQRILTNNLAAKISLMGLLSVIMLVLELACIMLILRDEDVAEVLRRTVGLVSRNISALLRLYLNILFWSFPLILILGIAAWGSIHYSASIHVFLINKGIDIQKMFWVRNGLVVIVYTFFTLLYLCFLYVETEFLKRLDELKG